MVDRWGVAVATVALLAMPSVTAGDGEPDALLTALSTPDGIELHWAVDENAESITSFTLHWSVDGEAQTDTVIPAEARAWFVGAQNDNGFIHEFQLTVNTKQGEVSVSNTAYASEYPHCDVIDDEFPHVHPFCLLPPPIP